MKKIKKIDHPAGLVGKIVFEFFNNSDEDFKSKSIMSLCKSLRKEFQISCIPINDYIIEFPERGSLAFTFCCANMQLAKALHNKILAYIDEKIPARIIDESSEEFEVF